MSGPGGPSRASGPSHQGSRHRPTAWIRSACADDDDLVRAGLLEVLSNDPTIEIVGQAATGREAIERARRHAPEVVLMDVRMPDLDGITATRELTRAASRARVLILTTFEQDDYVFGALRAGASGFLLKRARPEELIAAVHTIAAGDSLLSPSVARRVIFRISTPPPTLVCRSSAFTLPSEAPGRSRGGRLRPGMSSARFVCESADPENPQQGRLPPIARLSRGATAGVDGRARLPAEGLALRHELARTERCALGVLDSRQVHPVVAGPGPGSS